MPGLYLDDKTQVFLSDSYELWKQLQKGVSSFPWGKDVNYCVWRADGIF